MASPPGIGPVSGRQILQNNMREARSHGYGRNAALPQTYLWFYQKVRGHGPWDYKQFNPYWATFGNFNFGAAGTAAGIPANILLMGAGWAQSRAGTSKPDWGNWSGDAPYGDDPDDQRANRTARRPLLFNVQPAININTPDLAPNLKKRGFFLFRK